MSGRVYLGLAVVLGSATTYFVGLPSLVYTPALVGSIVLAVATVSGWLPWGLAIRLGTLVLMSTLMLSVCDLALRPLLGSRLSVDPHQRFVHRWPDNGALHRHIPNARFEGETYGDLARMSNKPEHRQLRNSSFETDAIGFRNSPPFPEEPLDIILLGDSFGMGAGTSQDETWAAQLQDRWGYRAYSLSIPGGPWHELMNLKIELSRLPVREGTVVLWAIFGGNDLADGYERDLEVRRNGPLKQWVVRFKSFRLRSPIRQIAQRLTHSSLRSRVIERDLPDGRSMLFFEPYEQRARQSLEEVEQHPNYSLMRRVFDEMERFAGARGLDVRVVLVPSKYEVYSWLVDDGSPEREGRDPSGFDRAVSGLCEEHGFDSVNLKAPMIDAAIAAYETDGELLWWRDDTHWNGPGHALAADLVHGHLRETGEATAWTP